MNANRFDAISKLMAQRHLTRRQALAQSGTAIAVGAAAAAGVTALAAVPSAAAQAATPTASPASAPAATPAAATVNPLNVPMLFVQAFQSGNLEALGTDPHRFTVRLDHGLGQTIYFSDRPDRIVGALPTADFLKVLGFREDNPPNAAILVEREAGHTDFAVVELFNPVYDPAKFNLSYDITVLDNWDKVVGQDFINNPAEPPPTSFASATLLIDGIADCPDAVMSCRRNGQTIGVLAGHEGHCYSWGDFACFPCDPWGESPRYFDHMCNDTYPECHGECHVTNFCSRDAPLGHTYCH